MLGFKRLQGFLELLQLRNRSRIGINKWYQSFALRNFDLEDMEFESTNSSTTAKLPILKLGEYEMWVIRIKQYFQIQDYALWVVIKNGDSLGVYPVTTNDKENGTSVTKMSVPVTAEEKTNKKNDVKARSLLLMALSNEHQLTFNQYPDAKSMFAAIETPFGVSTASPQVSTVSPNVNAASPQVSTASVSDNNVYAFMVENPNGSNVPHQDLEQIHEDDLEAMDLKCKCEKVKQEKDVIEFKIEKFDKASKDLDQVLGSQITDKSKKGLGYSVVPPPHPLIYIIPKKLDLSYVCDKKSDKENSEESLLEEQVSQDISSFVESSPNVDKETVFPVNKKINCDNHQIKGIVTRNNYSRVDAKNTHPSVHRNMSPRAVLLKTGLTPLNTIRLVNTAHPKSAVHSAKSKSHFYKQSQSTAQRPFYKKTTLTRRFVHTAKRHYYTSKPRAVNTARSFTGQVRTVRGKPQQYDKGFVNSGCSRHMIGNIAYLSDFKEFKGGYVAFGGGAYGGRVTGKGTLKTDNLNFEDIYFLPDKNQILLKIPRKDNMYSFDMKNIVPKESLTCLVTKATNAL
ncbi:hypothetical protein Tco_0833372, partial [Tanacetum coccineum]